MSSYLHTHIRQVMSMGPEMGARNAVKRESIDSPLMNTALYETLEYMGCQNFVLVAVLGKQQCWAAFFF